VASAITASVSSAVVCEGCGWEVGAVDGGEKETEVAWVAEDADDATADEDASGPRPPVVGDMYGGDEGVVGWQPVVDLWSVDLAN
jgi:hypothetical protein